MNPDTSPPLNQGQQEAADGFFQFLFGEGKELIISGPGGVGKTFLMGHMIDEIMPRYIKTCKLMGIPTNYEQVHMTAMTNKAAEVLSTMTGKPTQTIHSFLNLRVKDNYQTGKSQLIPNNNYKIQENKIIFIDEASMIDYNLLEMIHKSTRNCKIIYVGDHCQLSPIMEPISPIYTRNLPFFELTEQMRNNGQPALMAVCQQLRDTVETGVFNPIKVVPGVIDHLDDSEMEREIQNNFLTYTNSRILAYTNSRVVAYNDHIRELRQMTGTYAVGENLVNNSAIQFPEGMLSVDEEVQITWLAPHTRMVDIEDGVEMEVRDADLRTKFGGSWTSIALPENKEHFSALVRHYSGVGRRTKNWQPYFYLKNRYPDLRPRDSSTVHKAQGSTYDTSFIDLGNLSSCRDKKEAARLLYVAFSRAKNRIVLYGDLTPKFGGLIK